MTGIICFVLMIGASFNVVLRTGTFDCLIDFIIRKLEDKEILLIPILQLVLSLLGSCLGLTEEFIPLAMFMIPMFVKLGYDSLTGLLVMYLAPFLGSVLTWMNPFTLVVAQGIADIPILSGAWYRVILYVIFICLTVLSIFFRGSLGKLTPTIDVAYLFLYISIVSFVGKFIGGLFAKKICLIISFALSIISAFFISSIYGLLIFTFSINILMPLTLDYLRKSFYKYEATSLGISAFVLLIGTYLFNSVDQNSKQIYFIVFLVLHLCILAFFFFLEVRRKKN